MSVSIGFVDSGETISQRANHNALLGGGITLMIFHSLLGDGLERKRPITAMSILPSALRWFAAHAAGNQPRFDHAKGVCRPPRIRVRVPERRKRFAANAILLRRCPCWTFHHWLLFVGLIFLWGFDPSCPGAKGV